ncbi:MAG: endonuclease/exonuclease/phosphatase family protein [Dysgonamonadaceae bacterium]|jgi:endonuclease/exonuclease/phosphatase family metal-dependent hydrolase|nr:endonuclease/exonuclease/phosphatase family protein [Dysgonamonadaceae bacterium]
MRAKNKKWRFRDVVKYLIFGTNVIVILLLVCSLFAWKVSPLKTNFFSYVGLAFGFVLFANVFYLVFWIFFSKWKLALISLAALLICHKPIFTFFPVHLFPAEVPEGSIKILSYNVQGLGNEYKRGANEHPILDYIAKTDADIVCLQEYMVSKTGKSMITQGDVNRILNKYPYRSVTGLESSGKYHIFGLACFSKFPIKNTHEIIFDSSFNGAVTYTLDIEGKDVTVVNVHLESNQIGAADKRLYSDFLQNNEKVRLDDVTSNIRKRLGRAYRKRASQVDKIKRYVARLDNETTILCGDFNDTPASFAYGKMKEGLRDAYAETGTGPGITYNEDLFLFRIDYIMHSENMKAYRAKVNNVKFSDHYPLQAYLKWK